MWIPFLVYVLLLSSVPGADSEELPSCSNVTVFCLDVVNNSYTMDRDFIPELVDLSITAWRAEEKDYHNWSFIVNPKIREINILVGTVEVFYKFKIEIVAVEGKASHTDFKMTSGNKELVHPETLFEDWSLSKENQHHISCTTTPKLSHAMKLETRPLSMTVEISQKMNGAMHTTTHLTAKPRFLFARDKPLSAASKAKPKTSWLYMGIGILVCVGLMVAIVGVVVMNRHKLGRSTTRSTGTGSTDTASTFLSVDDSSSVKLKRHV